VSPEPLALFNSNSCFQLLRVVIETVKVKVHDLSDKAILGRSNSNVQGMSKIVACAHTWLKRFNWVHNIRSNVEFCLLFVELSAKDEMFERILWLVHCGLTIMHLIDGLNLLTTTELAGIACTGC
jgi:hypothetical protein